MPCRILTLQSEAQWPLLGDMLAGRYDPDDAVEPVVRDILTAVRSKGDEALAEYTRRFDCPDFTPALLHVTSEEVAQAVASVPADDIAIIRQAADRKSVV